MTVRARYYFGQPVSHGTVKLVTYSSSYWSPWKYLSSDGDEGDGGEPGYYGDESDEYEAELDEKGEATISVDLPESDSSGDLALRLEARVTDASEREVSGRTSVVATAGPWVVAVDTGRYLQAPGSTANVRVRVVDYAGKPQANVPVKLVLGKPERAYDWGGAWKVLEYRRRHHRRRRVRHLDDDRTDRGRTRTAFAPR